MRAEQARAVCVGLLVLTPVVLIGLAIGTLLLAIGGKVT